VWVDAKVVLELPIMSHDKGIEERATDHVTAEGRWTLRGGFLQ